LTIDVFLFFFDYVFKIFAKQGCQYINFMTP